MKFALTEILVLQISASTKTLQITTLLQTMPVIVIVIAIAIVTVIATVIVVATATAIVMAKVVATTALTKAIIAVTVVIAVTVMIAAIITAIATMAVTRPVKTKGLALHTVLTPRPPPLVKALMPCLIPLQQRKPPLPIFFMLRAIGFTMSLLTAVA